jgi:hypothetical protein
MSGSVSQTFGELFGRIGAMLDSWEFWGRILMLAVAIAIFNGVTGFFRERILEGMETRDDDSYSRADGQARVWAIIVIFAVGFGAAWIADQMSGY